jgi:hypothetical protein
LKMSLKFNVSPYDPKHTLDSKYENPNFYHGHSTCIQNTVCKPFLIHKFFCSLFRFQSKQANVAKHVTVFCTSVWRSTAWNHCRRKQRHSRNSEPNSLKYPKIERNVGQSKVFRNRSCGSRILNISAVKTVNLAKVFSYKLRTTWVMWLDREHIEWKFSP